MLARIATARNRSVVFTTSAPARFPAVLAVDLRLLRDGQLVLGPHVTAVHPEPALTADADEDTGARDLGRVGS